jgi:hypothetical protein
MDISSDSLFLYEVNEWLDMQGDATQDSTRKYLWTFTFFWIALDLTKVSFVPN